MQPFVEEPKIKLTQLDNLKMGFVLLENATLLRNRERTWLDILTGIIEKSWDKKIRWFSFMFVCLVLISNTNLSSFPFYL